MKADEGRRRYMVGEYISRINGVIDYIEANMGRELTLEELAATAGFSKFHFHRIFFSFVGETIFHFIQRLRLEKGAALLLNEPGKPVTDIALECGFAGSSSFAKSFRKHFGVSAKEWRQREGLPSGNPGQTKSKQRQMESNGGQELSPASVYIEYVNNTQRWRFVMDKEKETRTVDVKDLPEMSVAYVRYVGPYKGDGQLFERLFGQLFRWAAPRNLLNSPDVKTLIIYHDDPEITEEEKLRVSVCLTVPPETSVEGEIGKMVIPAGKYALARFELGVDEYQQAWDWVFSTWLPESGYLPDDRPCFELCHNDPQTHPEGKSIVDICIGVKPM